MIAMVRIPDPPLLSTRGGIEELRLELTSAWRGAVIRHYGDLAGLTCRKPKVGDKAVDHTGNTLRDLGVPPTVWMLAAFARWDAVQAATGKKLVRPSLAWCLSVKSLEKHGRQVHRDYEQGAFRGGHSHCISSHKALATKWLEMQADVLQRNVSTKAELYTVVLQHFPVGAFERAVAQCQAEAAQETAKLMRDIRNGVCFWG